MTYPKNSLIQRWQMYIKKSPTTVSLKTTFTTQQQNYQNGKLLVHVLQNNMLHENTLTFGSEGSN